MFFLCFQQWGNVVSMIWLLASLCSTPGLAIHHSSPGRQRHGAERSIATRLKKAPRGPVSLSSAMVLRHPPPPKKKQACLMFLFVFTKAQHVRGSVVFGNLGCRPLLRNLKVGQRIPTYDRAPSVWMDSQVEGDSMLSHQYDALKKYLQHVFMRQKMSKQVNIQQDLL